jgi:hypothetical protein
MKARRHTYTNAEKQKNWQQNKFKQLERCQTNERRHPAMHEQVAKTPWK